MTEGAQIRPQLKGWRKLLLCTAGVAATLTSAHPRTQSPSAQSEPPSSERPNFDAASIKRNTSGGQGMMIPIDLPGGHVSARNATLRFLISVAYKLPSLPKQTRVTLVGTPGWVDSEHFDIEAEVEGNPPTEEKRLMLQSLLADRFKLTVHHETRQLPAFALVLDKGSKPGPLASAAQPGCKVLGSLRLLRRTAAGAGFQRSSTGALRQCYGRARAVLIVEDRRRERHLGVLGVDSELLARN